MDADGLKELFEPFGAVVVKRMFGGYGIYFDDLVFAIQVDGEVYLKTDPGTEAHFAAAGSGPFVYEARGKPMKMSFWRLPTNAYDDADELKRWSGLALETARRAALAKASQIKPAKAAKTKPVKAKSAAPSKSA